MRICAFYSRIIGVGLFLVLAGCHAKQGQFYQIYRGDTAYRIAHVHDIAVADIQKANPQKNLSQLRAGDQLWIPSTLKKARASNQAMEKKLAAAPAPRPAQKTTAVSTETKKTEPMYKPSSKAPPLYWPYKGKVIGEFGMHNQKMHNGIDIEIPSAQNIKASQNGQVAYVGDGIEGYGLTVIVQHDGYLFSVYAYLGQTLVEKGQNVVRGQSVGKPKKQGETSFFHFEIRKVKTALNPLQLLL